MLRWNLNAEALDAIAKEAIKRNTGARGSKCDH